jgi:hypothetical protein
MKEYTYDSAKVRRFAKRASLTAVPRGRRKWHIPATAAAAAASVAIGVTAFFFQGGGGSPAPHDSMLPLHVRAEQANFAARTASLSFETKTMYLSFNDSVTFSEMQNALDTVSDTGNIVIEAVYVLAPNNEVTTFRDLDEVRRETAIVGVKLSAPAVLIDDLLDTSVVDIIEFKTDVINDETFVPLSAAIAAAGLAAGLADVTTAPVSQTTAEETAAESASESAAGESARESGHEPGVTVVVNLNIPGVLEAKFIGDRRFTAITADSVVLYEISEDLAEVEVVAEYSMSNHRKRPSATGESVLISDGKSLLLIDGAAAEQSLTQIDLSEVSGELQFAFYDDVNGRIIMRTRVSGDDAVLNIISVSDRNGEPGNVREIITSNDTTTVLGVMQPDSAPTSLLYYADNSVIYGYDFATDTAELLYSFEGEAVSFERNADLSAFAVNGTTDGESWTRIFADGSLGEPVETHAPAGLVFCKNTDTLTDGTSFYSLCGARLAEAPAPAESARAASSRGSRLFSIAEITADTVRILLKPL